VVVEEALTAPIDLLDVVATAVAVDPDPVVDPESDPESEPEVSDQPDDVWVHRPLIRATLPRPEGQVPERKAPDFTIRQNSRFDGRNGNNRHRGQRAGEVPGQGQSRFGNSRSGGGGHGSRVVTVSVKGIVQGVRRAGSRAGGRPPRARARALGCGGRWAETRPLGSPSPYDRIFRVSSGSCWCRQEALDRLGDRAGAQHGAAAAWR
jgi:hypothetical protein